MSRETKVPAIPDIRPDNVQEVLRAIKATLDVREGSIGNPLDQGATLRDLVDLNLAEAATTSAGVRSAGPILNPVMPPLLSGYNPATDYTTPPAPTGLRARGGFTNVFLEWDGAPYRNHGFTEIWRSQVDNIGTAYLIGTTAANVYADPADGDTTYYYWIRFVSAAAITGPYNQTSGTVAKTAIDVAAAISVLSQEITGSQLYVDLSTRIGAVETGIQQIAKVTSTSASQINTLASAVNGNSAAIEVAQMSVDGVRAQYTVKIDNNGHVSGFGLASTTVNGTPRSAFIVRADRFAIVGANDTSDPLGTLTPTKVPFMVFTTPTVVGGKTYPAGTWIDTAFIANATIGTAQIADLTADKITTGTLTATIGISTGRITGGVNTSFAFGSTNFGTGFYLGNDGGTYKFRVGSPTYNMTWDGTNLSVTGNINAISGTFRGITVYDNSNNVILSSTGINTSLLSIASGQVSGLGTLATQNNVTTGQVVGLGGLATQSSVFVGSTVRFGDGTIMNTGDFVNKLAKIGTGNISTFIDGLAITNAYIGNASISTAKIQDLAVGSAKIADAAIGTAKIDDLAVSTLKLQGESVFVTRYADGGIAGPTLTTSPTTLTSLAITIAGLPSGQTANMILTGFTNYSPSDGTGASVYTIITDSLGNQVGTVYGVSVFGEATFSGNSTMVSLPNGTHTYYLKAYVGGTGASSKNFVGINYIFTAQTGKR